MTSRLRDFTQALEKRFGIDLRTLALFRTCLSVMLLADLAMRSTFLAAFHSDSGVLPTAALSKGIFWGGRFSLHLLSGSVVYEAVLFVIAGIFALLLFIGYRTQLVTVISWVLLLSLQNRVPVILQGGDNLLLLMLFWGMFLPLGARWSVDAALAEDRNQGDNRYFSIATFALLMQCMSVYFFTALLKTGSAWLPQGSAVFMALQLDHMVTPVGLWLREFPLLTQVLTYFVWYLELLGPILIFSPLFFLPARLIVQASLIIMHIGFLLCLKIGFFPFISFVSLITFTPGWVWDRLAARFATPTRQGLRIFYDQECDFCRKICLLLRTFLILPGVPIEPAQIDEAKFALMQEQNSWVVEDIKGKTFVRWQAVALLFDSSPVFWPLGWIMKQALVAWPGDLIYAAIAHNRGRLSKVSSLMLPYGEIRTGLPGIATIAVATLASIVLIINVTSLEQLDIEEPMLVQQVKSTLRLDQKWSMFSPIPLQASVWYSMQGRTVGGSLVDLWHLQPELPVDGLSIGPGHGYPYFRWRKYLHNLQTPEFEYYRPFFADYLCRQWNDESASDNTLSSVQIYVNRVNNKLDWNSGRDFKLDKISETNLLYEQDCPTDDAHRPRKKAHT